MTFAHHWTLDPDTTFLNHGSFGATPAAVLEHQSQLRARMERDPVLFMAVDLQARLDEARAQVAAFVGARPEGFFFVRNATSGVNAVLRSLVLAPGDEVLTTQHEYGACANTLAYVAKRSGARVVVAPVPFPVQDSGQVVDAVMAHVTPRTRLCLVDHVTSPTALVFPVRALVERLEAAGVMVLVDGAHAPGMLELDVEKLGASFYVANFHKWTCAPKGAGMLWVRKDRQAGLHPAVISHGYSYAGPGNRLAHEFDWTGTDDPTPMLCVPVAIATLAAMVPGGWPQIRARNHALALAGRDALCATLEISPPAPDDMLGSMAAVPLPDSTEAPSGSALYMDALQVDLYERHRIQVPVPPWPAHPHRLVRISAHLHNTLEDYQRLAKALKQELAPA